MYLDELSSYKIEIMKTICLNENIISLLRPSNKPGMTGKDMMYKYIFPYVFINDTITEVSTFICFDLSVPRVQNRTFKDVTMDFWIFTHDSLMRCESGLRLDTLASLVDRLLNGNRNFGLGEVSLKTVKRCHVAKDYYGIILTYRTVDFNRKV